LDPLVATGELAVSRVEHLSRFDENGNPVGDHPVSGFSSKEPKRPAVRRTRAQRKPGTLPFGVRPNLLARGIQ
jgi:hypothetical protein